MKTNLLGLSLVALTAAYSRDRQEVSSNINTVTLASSFLAMPILVIARKGTITEPVSRAARGEIKPLSLISR